MGIDEFCAALKLNEHPGFRVSRKKTGYKDYVFGCRLGVGRANLSTLAHDLAHAAQFGPRQFRRRVMSYGFHFGVRKVEIRGRYYDEPETPNGILRELETYAIQARLMEKAGHQFCRTRLFKHASTLMIRWMSDWHCVPGENTQEREAWCYARVCEFYKKRSEAWCLRRLNAWLDKTAEVLNT